MTFNMQSAKDLNRVCVCGGGEGWRMVVVVMESRGRWEGQGRLLSCRVPA